MPNFALSKVWLIFATTCLLFTAAQARAQCPPRNDAALTHVHPDGRYLVRYTQQVGAPGAQQTWVWDQLHGQHEVLAVYFPVVADDSQETQAFLDAIEPGKHTLQSAEARERLLDEGFAAPSLSPTSPNGHCTNETSLEPDYPEAIELRVMRNDEPPPHFLTGRRAHIGDGHQLDAITTTNAWLPGSGDRSPGVVVIIEAPAIDAACPARSVVHLFTGITDCFAALDPWPRSVQVDDLEITAGYNHELHTHGGESARVASVALQVMQGGADPVILHVDEVALLNRHCRSKAWTRRDPRPITGGYTEPESALESLDSVSLELPPAPKPYSVTVTFEGTEVYQACDGFAFLVTVRVGDEPATHELLVPLEVTRMERFPPP